MKVAFKKLHLKDFMKFGFDHLVENPLFKELRFIKKILLKIY